MNINPHALGGFTIVVLCAISLFLVWYDRDPPDDDDDFWGV